MAELVVKVGSVSPNPAHWQDGDIIMACNDRSIGCVHSEIICDINKNPFTSEGLRDVSGLNYKRRMLTSRCRFTVLNKREVKCEDLVTGGITIYSDIPNAQGHHIHLQEHLSCLMSEPTRRVFGSLGSEVWFGYDDTRISAPDIDAVWNMIKLNTVHRREHFPTFPFGDTELSHNLMISVDDMTDDEAHLESESEVVTETFTPPETRVPETRDRVVKLRKKFISWGSLYTASERRSIKDMSLKVDKRGVASKTRSRSLIVKVKT